MKNFEIGGFPGEPREFRLLTDLIGSKDHIDGSCKYGAVSIHRRSNGSIEVTVVGKDRTKTFIISENNKITTFTISESMEAQAVVEKPASSKFSYEGGGTEKNNLIPEFSLNDVLASFRENP